MTSTGGVWGTDKHSQACFEDRTLPWSGPRRVDPRNLGSVVKRLLGEAPALRPSLTPHPSRPVTKEPRALLILMSFTGGNTPNTFKSEMPTFEKEK